MKKKLQAEIKEIANQLINEGTANKTATLKKTVASLYEKLSILEYLENQLSSEEEPHKNEALDSKSFREENWFTEPEPLPQPENKEDMVEPVMEKIKDIVAQMPEEAQHVDEMLEKVIPHKKYVKNDLEEFASRYQQTPVFERKETGNFPKSEIKFPISESQPKSLNDKLNQGLNIGLNDRLAFIKHLFDGNSEDYSRVLSQINSMDSFDEADVFIKEKIKPDYNYWLKKEEYSDRFMHLIEKKFQ